MDYQKIIRIIQAIYREPNYTVTDKDYTTQPNIQKTGIRQGCPLSPYLFIMLMTVIMHDVEQSYTEVENDIATRDRLHKQVNDKPFYADDTIIMAKTAGAVEMMLQKMEV